MEAEMKEALKVIASAWSVAFVVLFFASVTTAPQAGLSSERVHIILFLMVAAVTGSGWLWFRHKLKKQHPPVQSAKNS
jgi:protein-S-isoprenylcysteine O-methyltransferase Ste14